MIKLQCTTAAQSSRIAANLFHLELAFHKRNATEAHLCLKSNLGTDESSKLFYHLLSLRSFKFGAFGAFLRIRVVEIVQDFLRTSSTISFVNMCLKIAFQLFVHSWDLIKDIYLLFVYSEFVRLSIDAFASFGFQTFIILSTSIVIPNILNIVYLVSEKSGFLQTRARLLLIIFAPVSQSVIGYTINRIQFAKKNLQIEYSKFAPEHRHQMLAESIRTFEKTVYNLSHLQAKLRTNEGTFECSVQALVLIIAIAIILR